MIKSITLFAILGLSVQLALSAPTDKVDCSKVDEVIDDLGSAQGMTTMNDKYKLATTNETMVVRCKEMTDAIKTLRKYNKECFSSLTQQVFSATLRTRSQFNDARCNNMDGPEYKAGIEASKCIQENAFEKVKEAEKKTILASQVLLDANIADEKLRLRRACCAVLNSKNLFLSATNEKCAKYEKVYSDYVDSYTSEAMAIICSEPEKLECNKIEMLKLDGVEPKTKFFLGPMLKLVKSLDH